MRRLLFLPLVLLGFASAVAIGSNDSRTIAAKSSVAGTISALSSTSITVHSVFDVTCKIMHDSPKLADYAVGDQVKIRCEHGILTRLKHAVGAAATPGGSTSGNNSEHATTTTPGTTSTASGLGAITSISTSSSTVTVTGDRSLTCTLVTSSPSLAGYHVGDHVRIGCLNGALYVITRTDLPPPTSTTTTIPAATSTIGHQPVRIRARSGLLSSATSIEVTGDRSLTCSIGAGSPTLGDYHVGDHVKMGCQNGVLVAIVRDTTTTTTTAPAPSTTTTATSTTPTSYTSVTGSITALSASSISVTGDGIVLDLRPIGTGAQSPDRVPRRGRRPSSTRLEWRLLRADRAQYAADHDHGNHDHDHDDDSDHDDHLVNLG